jgi:hypothetical protein
MVFSHYTYPYLDHHDRKGDKMKRRLSVVILLALLATMVLTVGCATTDKIGDILANPLQYEGQEVKIEGTVGNTMWLSLLSQGAYQVGDGTGNIWVTTNQPPPQKGHTVSVRGTVQPAVSLGGTSLGTVIVESKRG